MYRWIQPFAVVALISTPALADMPGHDWISRGKVSSIVAKRGAKVVKLEADDGHWEGEALRRGVRYEFHVDPHTGLVTKWERDDD